MRLRTFPVKAALAVAEAQLSEHRALRHRNREGSAKGLLCCIFYLSGSKLSPVNSRKNHSLPVMASTSDLSPDLVSKLILEMTLEAPNEEMIIDINPENGSFIEVGQFEELSAYLDEENIDDYKEGGYHPCQVGDLFKDGRYKIFRKLGWGYFSTVWLATDTEHNDSLVALKVVRAAQNYTETAIDEIKLLKKLGQSDPDHPGAQFVVRMHDQFFHMGPHGSHVCMVFEVLGENLLSLIKRYHYKGVPSIMVKQITMQMMLALDYSHRQCGIIHTDLKPENVLIRIPDVNLVMEQIKETEMSKVRQNELLSRYEPDSQAPNKDDAANFAMFSDEVGTNQGAAVGKPLDAAAHSPKYDNLGVLGSCVNSLSESSQSSSDLKSISGAIPHTGCPEDDFHCTEQDSLAASIGASSNDTLIQGGSQPETVPNNSDEVSWAAPREVAKHPAASDTPLSKSARDQAILGNMGIGKESASIDTASSSISGESIKSVSSSTSQQRVRKMLIIGSQPLPSPLRRPEDRRSISTDSVLSSNHQHQRRHAPTSATSAKAATGTKTLSSASQAEHQTFNIKLSQAGARQERLETYEYPESIQPGENEGHRTSGFTALEDELITVSIADFGNSCTVEHHYTDDIQTRQYRAPEIIMGSPWGAGVDCWSLACMIFELLTGDYLFEPQSGSTYSKDEDHIAQIIELLGPLPPYLQNGKNASKYFDGRGRLRNIHKLKVWPLYDVFVGKYNYDPNEARQLSDLLMSLLCLDPRKRKDCGSLIHCEWLRNTPGFEAIKINREPQLDGMDIQGWASTVPQTKAESDLEVKASQEEFDNLWVGAYPESAKYSAC